MLGESQPLTQKAKVEYTVGEAVTALGTGITMLFAGGAGTAAKAGEASGTAEALSNAENAAKDANETERAVKEITKSGIVTKTPYGDAMQDLSDEALALKENVSNGAYIYRAGQFRRSNAANAQFWASESPLNPNYADKYGVDFEHIDYVIRGNVKPGTKFITRHAPALRQNSGGALEVVTNPNDVNLNLFYMP